MEYAANVFVSVSTFFMTAQKKATYDKFGEEGLKGGIPLEFASNGAWSSKYVYHGNPDQTFKQFFGGDNPFAGEGKKQNESPHSECATSNVILFSFC